MKAADVWAKVKARLKEEMPANIYSTWIKPIRQAYYRQGTCDTLALFVPDNHYLHWWAVTNWKDHISNLLSMEMGKPAAVMLYVKEAE